MKKHYHFFFHCVFALLFQTFSVNAQTLGTYPNTTVVAGQNTTVIPGAVPTGTSSIVAFASGFSGLLSANPTTGVVTVTNARQAGTYTISVRATGVSTVTTTFTLTVTNPSCSQGQFTATTDVPVGTGPENVAVGDFNNDGILDIAVANTNNGFGNTISIRLGNGSGGFTGINDLVVGAGPKSVAIGDLNGDGMQDLAIANGGRVSIRIGDGLGGFSGTTEVAVNGSPYSVAIGDFNRDGRRDIVTANYSTNDISISHGNGLGGFGAAINVAVGNFPDFVAVGDFNADGKQDIAVSNYSDKSVYIIRHISLNTYSYAGSAAVGSVPFCVAVGDFNNDGKQDIAAANYDSRTVSIRLGDGNFGFSGTTEVPANAGPFGVAVGDFNGDGRQDIATANWGGTDDVSIRLGNGAGGFIGSTNVAVGSSPYSVAVGDFNGDGRQDIAAANMRSNNVSILLGRGNEAEMNVKGNEISIADGDITPDVADHTDFGVGSLTRTFTIENTGTGPLPIIGATITGANASEFLITRAPEVSVAAGGSTTVVVRFNPAAVGTRTAKLTIVNTDCSEGDYDFDLQGTGVMPVLGTYGNLSVISGQNASITPAAPPVNATSIVAGTNTNFTGILSVNPNTGVVTVTGAKQAGTYTVTVKAYYGAIPVSTNFTLTVSPPLCSQGLFAGSTSIPVDNGPQSVAIGDFNGDGKQDIATANSSSSNVSIRLGNGLGGFSGNTNVAIGLIPWSIAIGDFNGDGNQDFATANRTSNNVSIRLGDGHGGFSGSTNVAVGLSPWSLAIGDFNGDGNQDIATANSNANNVSIRLGNGFGDFGGTTNVAVGSTPYQVVIGDFNGDGNQDIATANQNSNDVSIRLGDGLGGFSGSTNLAFGTRPYSLALGDFNDDGKQDIATANIFSNNVSIRLGDGLGGFSGTTNVSAGTEPRSVVIGDFNGDGKQDIAAANARSNSVSIRLGDGTGGFSGSTEVAVGSFPEGVAVGEFNGDGRHDIAAVNASGSSVSIRLGFEAEINVKGNGMDIMDGDATPDAADHTGFGIVATGGSFSRTFTIQNTGTKSLGLSSISSGNPLFVVNGAPNQIAAGSSATFTVVFSPIVTGAQNAVIAINNDDCNEAVYEFAVSGTGACFPISTPPGTISGPDGVCRGATGQVFTVAPVSGADSYQWIIPNGATGSSTTNSITLDFSSAYNLGMIAVKAINGCSATALSARQVQVYLSKPGQPKPIIGKNLGTCTGNEIYSIPAVGYASGYNWVAPANTTIVSGQGTTTIELSFGTGFVSGNLSVTASNCMGTSTPRTLMLRTKPATPAAIAGPSSVCPGEAGVKFSTNLLAGITYNWVVPADATITGGQGTAAITVTWGSMAGNVKVSASNICGTSAFRSKMVSLLSCSSAITMAQAEQVPANVVNDILKVKLWPNPVRDALMVTLDEFLPNKLIELTLMQTDGKVQQVQSLMPGQKGQQVKMELSRAAAGYYILLVKQPGIIINRQVVIIR